jgi:hypothetical protein
MASRGAPRRRRSVTPYERPQERNREISDSSDPSSLPQSQENVPKTRSKWAWAWKEAVESGSTFKCSSCDWVWNKDKFRIGNFRTHFHTRHSQLCLERGYIEDASAAITTNAQLDLIVSRWILTSNRAFAIVDDPDFRTLVHGLNPSLSLLHRKQLMRTHLPRFSIALKDQVRFTSYQR